MAPIALQPRPPRELQVTSRAINLGDVVPGLPLSASVGVLNDSEVPIEVFKIVPSCGCTVIDRDELRLEPGDVATVQFSITPPKESGATEKAITLFYRPVAGNSDKSAALASRHTVVVVRYSVLGADF